VWDYAELFAEPQAAARGLRVTVRDPQGQPVDLVGTPFHIGGASLPLPQAPPRQGQDTDTVLTELLGLEAARLNELRRRQVI
jgi:crotonobetainyl-CoA:carnitine CoA-transferase CaiB-like acyl-CoA transferase